MKPEKQEIIQESYEGLPLIEAEKGESIFYASEKAIRISKAVDSKIYLRFNGYNLPVYPDSSNREINYLYIIELRGYNG